MNLFVWTDGSYSLEAFPFPTNQCLSVTGQTTLKELIAHCGFEGARHIQRVFAGI